MRLFIILSMIFIASCENSFDHKSIIGNYKSNNIKESNVLLNIMGGNRYRFCRLKCEEGRFFVWRKSSSKNYVIRFEGASIEEYSRDILSGIVGPQEVYRSLGPPSGKLDADIDISSGTIRILVDGVSETYLEKN